MAQDEYVGAWGSQATSLSEAESTSTTVEAALQQLGEAGAAVTLIWTDAIGC